MAVDQLAMKPTVAEYLMVQVSPSVLDAEIVNLCHPHVLNSCSLSPALQDLKNKLEGELQYLRADSVTVHCRSV